MNIIIITTDKVFNSSFIADCYIALFNFYNNYYSKITQFQQCKVTGYFLYLSSHTSTCSSVKVLANRLPVDHRQKIFHIEEKELHTCGLSARKIKKSQNLRQLFFSGYSLLFKTLDCLNPAPTAVCLKIECK